MRETKWALGASARKMKEGADEAKSAHKITSGQLLRAFGKLDKLFASGQVNEARQSWDTLVGHIGAASSHYGEGLQTFREVAGNLVAIDGPAKDINLIGQKALDLTLGEARVREDEPSISENLIELSDDLSFIESTLEVLRERLQVSMQRIAGLQTGLTLAEEAGNGAADQLKQYRDSF